MENQHVRMPCQVDKKKMGDYDVNHQPSAICHQQLYSTPLYFTRPFWSCTEAAENRSGPMWLWLVVVLFIVSTAYNRATEPVIGGVPPLDGKYVWPKHPMVVIGVATK